MKQSDYVRELAEKLQSVTANRDHTSVEEIQIEIANWLLDRYLFIYESPPTKDH